MPNPQVNLRIPPELEAPLRERAERQRTTIQDVILRVLSRSFRVRVKPPRRGKPPKP